MERFPVIQKTLIAYVSVVLFFCLSFEVRGADEPDFTPEPVSDQISQNEKDLHLLLLGFISLITTVS